MRLLLFSMICGLLLVPTLLVSAGEPDSRPVTELELTELAKSVAKLLRARDADSVSLGAFKCKRDPEISHGPGICKRLARELIAQGIKIEPKALHLLEGEYIDNIDKKSRRIFIELSCRVVERKGSNSTLVTLFRRGLFGEEALSDFLTPPAVILDPSATLQEREESLVKQNDNEKPAVHLQGTKIFGNNKMEYGVELLIKKKTSYVPREPTLKSGKLYVPLEKYEPFAIKLVNNTGKDAAATIHIDGLDVFSFSEMMRQGTAAPHWVVPKMKEAAVLGWPIRSGLSHEFLVTEYAKSAVAELNAAGNQVGIITVTFAAAWPKGTPAPDDEKARSTVAVGKGAPINTPLKLSPMNFGVTRTILNIRYQR